MYSKESGTNVVFYVSATEDDFAITSWTNKQKNSTFVV